jgi:hypothetical protein
LPLAAIQLRNFRAQDLLLALSLADHLPHVGLYAVDHVAAGNDISWVDDPNPNQVYDLAVQPQFYRIAHAIGHYRKRGWIVFAPAVDRRNPGPAAVSLAGVIRQRRCGAIPRRLQRPACAAISLDSGSAF